jgi:hypothetical protein
MLEKGEGEETSLSYTFRLSTAKLLLDLEDFDTASKVSYHKEGIFKGMDSRFFFVVSILAWFVVLGLDKNH